MPPADGQWGGVEEDGTVTGMIGMVARREADFAIDEITVNGNSNNFMRGNTEYIDEITVNGNPNNFFFFNDLLCYRYF